MSQATIYIIADGFNTKIGITTDLNKRMASYVTHNPTAKLFKTYTCKLDDAKRVELTIKHAFKDKVSSKSREWFDVSCNTIDRYVSALLYVPTEDEILPTMHGMGLTDEAHVLLNKILVCVDKNENSTLLKQQFAELFGSKFNLGIPEHKLPEKVVIKDRIAVDMNHCNSDSLVARKAIKSNYPEVPFNDHEYRFYHLSRLSSGHYVAFCTAMVTMPYHEALAEQQAKHKVIATANDLGWHMTFDNDWSWWFPEKTALIVFQPKTPILNKLAMFDKSLRKWVIERAEILKNEQYSNRDDLEKIIEDLSHDNSFPLDVNTFEELSEKYLTPFFGIYPDDEYADWLKDGYSHLINKWKSSNN